MKMTLHSQAWRPGRQSDPSLPRLLGSPGTSLSFLDFSVGASVWDAGSKQRWHDVSEQTHRANQYLVWTMHHSDRTLRSHSPSLRSQMKGTGPLGLNSLMASPPHSLNDFAKPFSLHLELTEGMTAINMECMWNKTQDLTFWDKISVKLQFWNEAALLVCSSYQDECCTYSRVFSMQNITEPEQSTAVKDPECGHFPATHSCEGDPSESVEFSSRNIVELMMPLTMSSFGQVSCIFPHSRAWRLHLCCCTNTIHSQAQRASITASQHSGMTSYSVWHICVDGTSDLPSISLGLSVQQNQLTDRQH